MIESIQTQNFRYIILFSHLFSTVTGSPVNDTTGRWRPGGGINVPVRIKITLSKQRVREIFQKLKAKEITAQILDA